MGRGKGHWTEMTSVPDLIDMPHRHIFFSLLLDPKTPPSYTCVCPQPHQIMPVACPLPVTWDRLTVLCNSLYLSVSGSACWPG